MRRVDPEIVVALAMCPGMFMYNIDGGTIYGEWEKHLVSPFHEMIRIFTNNYIAWWLIGVDILMLYKGDINRCCMYACVNAAVCKYLSLSLSLSLCSRLLQAWHRRDKHVFVWTVNEREDILHYRNELRLAVLTDELQLAQ